MISGEMDKIWILHSILCDEIRKWEAFSATPPVRLGVGQNDAQKCRGTNTKLQDDLIPQMSNKDFFMCHPEELEPKISV